MTMGFADHIDTTAIVADEKGYVANFEKLFGQISPREVQRRKFLNAMCQTGRIMAACRMSNTHKSSVQYWRKTDEQFEEAFQAACEVAGEMLLEVAHDHAINGTERVRPIFYQGDLVGEEVWREYDHKLLWNLIQANVGHGIPEHYKTKKELEVSGHITHLMELAEGAEEDQAEFDRRLTEAKDLEERTVEGEVRKV